MVKDLVIPISSNLASLQTAITKNINKLIGPKIETIEKMLLMITSFLTSAAPVKLVEKNKTQNP